MERLQARATVSIASRRTIPLTGLLALGWLLLTSYLIRPKAWATFSGGGVVAVDPGRVELNFNLCVLAIATLLNLILGLLAFLGFTLGRLSSVLRNGWLELKLRSYADLVRLLSALRYEQHHVELSRKLPDYAMEPFADTRAGKACRLRSSGLGIPTYVYTGKSPTG